MILNSHSKPAVIKKRAISDFSDYVSSSKAAFFEKYGNALDDLENWWINRAMAAVGDGCWSLTREAFRQARIKTDGWIEKVQLHPVSRRSKWSYRRYWKHQNARAGIVVE